MKVSRRCCSFVQYEVFPLKVYLRNKETQQTLQVIVSIHYDASFKCKWYLSIGALCVRRITAGSTQLSITQSFLYALNQPDPPTPPPPPVVNCWNRVNKRKVWINHRLIVLKSLGIDCRSRKSSNGDVSVGFWNGLTSLTSTLNTACSRLLSFRLEIYSLQGRFV